MGGSSPSVKGAIDQSEILEAARWKRRSPARRAFAFLLSEYLHSSTRFFSFFLPFSLVCIPYFVLSWSARAGQRCTAYIVVVLAMAVGLGGRVLRSQIPTTRR